MSEMTIANITDQVLRDEGEVLHLYYDSVGVPTIAVGCNLRIGHIPDDIARQITITPAGSRSLLALRIQDCLGDLAHLPWVAHLSEPRRGVLVSLCFNVGFHGLLAFHNMLAAMEAGDWVKAADELMASDAARKLPTRYGRLRTQLLTDTWQ